jgi:hypothetical protein
MGWVHRFETCSASKQLATEFSLLAAPDLKQAMQAYEQYEDCRSMGSKTALGQSSKKRQGTVQQVR